MLTTTVCKFLMNEISCDSLQANLDSFKENELSYKVHIHMLYYIPDRMRNM